MIGAGSHATFAETPRTAYVPAATAEYCCGFMFDHEREQVVLIEKNRPVWQAGLLNGVGGKIEPHEQPRDAMAREFLEETGIATRPEDWELVVILVGDGFKVSFYRTFADAHVLWARRSMTDEQVVVRRIRALPSNVIPNVKWLAPFCADPRVKLPLVVIDAPAYTTDGVVNET